MKKEIKDTVSREAIFSPDFGKVFVQDQIFEEEFDGPTLTLVLHRHDPITKHLRHVNTPVGPNMEPERTLAGYIHLRVNRHPGFEIPGIPFRVSFSEYNQPILAESSVFPYSMGSHTVLSMTRKSQGSCNLGHDTPVIRVRPGFKTLARTTDAGWLILFRVATFSDVKGNQICKPHAPLGLESFWGSASPILR